MEALGIISPGDVITGNDNIGSIVINGKTWYFSGNRLFNAPIKGVNSCNLFGTYEQVNNLQVRLGDGSFCN